FSRLLAQAVQAEPRTYRSLVNESGTGRRDRTPPPPDKRVRPPAWLANRSTYPGAVVPESSRWSPQSYCTEMDNPLTQSH
ncbi:MAG: hypothetical protein ACYDEY_15250, partial [Acidimicrobiales bacterium]